MRAIDALSVPISAGHVTHSLGVAIGVAMFPFPGANAEEVMRRADVALYKAKALEKSSMCIFDREMDRHVRERALIERELRAAVAAGDIEPFFQPLVDLKTKVVAGFEALARWTHKELGEIPPDRFIPIAEDTGLIHDLSDRLLRQACAAARAWPDGGVLSPAGQRELGGSLIPFA